MLSEGWCTGRCNGCCSSGHEEEDDDPSLERDEYQELQGFNGKMMTAQQSCRAQEYLNGDNDLSVCVWNFIVTAGKMTSLQNLE